MCPVGLELVGHGPDLVEVSGGHGDEFVDLGDEHVAYGWVWHGADTSVSRGPAVVAVRPPLCVVSAEIHPHRGSRRAAVIHSSTPLTLPNSQGCTTRSPQPARRTVPP